MNNLIFPKTVRALGESTFKKTFINETLKQTDLLPLHKACHRGGMVKADSLSLSILNVTEDQGFLKVKSQIFFDEVVGGCNCHDDPYEQVQMCEALFIIDQSNAETEFVLLSE